MGILNKTRVYLAGPIEYEDGQEWRQQITPYLTQMGITVFNPFNRPFIGSSGENAETLEELKRLRKNGEYELVSKKMKEIRIHDLRLCDLSDFLIVCVSPKVSSWGTVEELSLSNRQKKPIFLWVKGGKRLTPLWIMGMIPHSYIYDEMWGVLNTLSDINTGETKLDERWKILREDFR